MIRAAAADRTDRDRASALRALRALIAGLGRSARSIEWRTGFTNAQLFLLRQLEPAAALSVNELAERARTSQSTVSSVLGRVVRAGLVRRERAPDDGRRVALTITPQGRRLLRRAPTPPTEALFDALESLTDREARGLATGLGALVTALGLVGEQAPMLFQDAPRTKGVRR
ncbi:MAG: MarR family winged helix-turn-helix transcriptional regulator [Gemmatimonadales bacterium]